MAGTAGIAGQAGTAGQSGQAGTGGSGPVCSTEPPLLFKHLLRDAINKTLLEHGDAWFQPWNHNAQGETFVIFAIPYLEATVSNLSATLPPSAKATGVVLDYTVHVETNKVIEHYKIFTAGYTATNEFCP